MSKWTKEQIAFAKIILKWNGCGSEEDQCRCCFSDGKCPFLTGNGIGPSYEKFSGEHAQLIKKLIAQHERDADEPLELPNTVIDPKMGQTNIPAGQSVHDYWRYQFAGMALQGFLANHECIHDSDLISQRSIEYADELLKQLEGGK